MSEHAYNSSPEHTAWCPDCWNKEQRVVHVLAQYAREQARWHLQQCADAIAADPKVWQDFEYDLADTNCQAIAALF